MTSTMHSFAVVNLADESRSDLPTKLFEALQEHGVHLPCLGGRSDLSRARHLWEELRVDVYVAPRRTVDSRRLRGAFLEGRDKARNTFLTKRLAHGLCFPTIARVDLHGDGALSALEVVVFPTTDEEGASIPEGCYGAMDIEYLEQNNPSHTVTLRDGKRIDAWLRYQIDNGDRDAKPGDNNCSHCDGKGCYRCCPLITCLVAQIGTRQNIRLVPTDRSVEVFRNNKNVPSGTCVDSNELLVPQHKDVA